MAGTIVSKSAAAAWFQEAIKSIEDVTLTNYSNTSEPQVTSGSRVVISQEIYTFSSAESITGWSGISNSTQAYIKFVPSGDSCTVAFTSTAPTWSDAKQGWYGTGGAANDRYIFDVYKDGSGNYTLKCKRPEKSADRYAEIEEVQSLTMTNAPTFNGGADIGGNGVALKVKVLNIGDWDMDADISVTVAHGVTAGNIRSVSVIIRNDADTQATQLDYTIVANTAGYWGITGATNITLVRVAGEIYDSTSYDSTSYNRGWVTIWYES